MVRSLPAETALCVEPMCICIATAICFVKLDRVSSRFAVILAASAPLEQRAISHRGRAMPTLSTDNIGRAGEHYVAAKLNRRGAYASPFSGNVPGIDIIATDDDQNRMAYIQVKTKRGRGNWHMSLNHGWARSPTKSVLATAIVRKPARPFWRNLFLENQTISGFSSP